MVSALSMVAWVTALIAFIAAGIAILPNGSDHPFPAEVGDALVTLYQWLYSFNFLFPVDTLVQVLVLGILVDVFARFVWPIIFWVMKTVTGGGQ